MQKVTEIEKAELLNAVKISTELHDAMRRLLIEHDRIQELEQENRRLQAFYNFFVSAEQAMK